MFLPPGPPSPDFASRASLKASCHRPLWISWDETNSYSELDPSSIFNGKIAKCNKLPEGNIHGYIMGLWDLFKWILLWVNVGEILQSKNDKMG